MAVYSSKSGKDLTIAVEETDGEIRLKHNGHVFAKCYTNEKGEHVVEVLDVDTGSRFSSVIPILCWRR